MSEVSGLRVSDLRREDGKRSSPIVAVQVRGKGKRERLLPIPRDAEKRFTRRGCRLQEALEEWLQVRRDLGIRSHRLFTTISRGTGVHPARKDEEGRFVGGETVKRQLERGGPVNPRYVQQMVARIARKADVEQKVTPHVLRHTAATELLRATGDIALVSKFLGHADVSTSMIYSHLVTEDLANGLAKVGAQEPEEAEETEAEKVARQLLANLPSEVREALGRLSGD